METDFAKGGTNPFYFIFSILFVGAAILLLMDSSHLDQKESTHHANETAEPAEPTSPIETPQATVETQIQLPQLITGKDGEQMVYVPDGVFFMGHNDGDPVEKPRMRVFLDGFYVDRFEIGNGRFAAFIAETGYKPEAGFNAGEGIDYLPARHLTWRDVNKYCEWAGKRMLSEYEWEKAARGVDGRKWHWGNDDKKSVGTIQAGQPDMFHVQQDPSGQSPYGCMHMAGNVWEWVDDWFNGYVLNPDPDPRYGEKYKVLRGGMEINGNIVKHAPATRRMFLAPGTSTEFTGGRCARAP